MLVISYIGKETAIISFKSGSGDYKVTLKATPIVLKEIVNSVKITEKKESVSNDGEVRVVEQQPEYPGGYQEMMRFIMTTVKYPIKAMEANVQGKVLVSFIVDKQGKIKNAKISSGVSEELDTEALRVVNAMPLWIPGKQRGEPTDVEVVIPIIFALNNPEKNSSENAATFMVLGHKQGSSVGTAISKSSLVHSYNISNFTNKTTVKTAFQLGGDESVVTARDSMVILETPLYVLDGVMMSSKFDIKSLDPLDIESVTVLKSKVAICLYGNKGRNGVIVITRKGGASKQDVTVRKVDAVDTVTIREK